MRAYSKNVLEKANVKIMREQIETILLIKS